MKILMISLDKTLLGQVGIGDAIRRHQEYAKQVESLEVLVFSKAGYQLNNLAPNLEIYPTNSWSRWFYIFKAYQLGCNILKTKKVDLIVTQDPLLTGLVGWLLKIKFKVKLFVDLHGDFLTNKFWLKEKWYNRILFLVAKFIINRADGLRPVSRGVAADLSQFKVSEQKIFNISTPVDLQSFAQVKTEEIDFLKHKYAGHKVILFVGRLVPAKGLDTLLQALKIVVNGYPKVVCILAGDGEERFKLQVLAKQLEIAAQLEILGLVDHQKLSVLYHLCDLVVLPSTNESFGKVLLEGAMAQKPAVATATTGPKEIIIDGQTGFIVPIGNAEKLAEKILLLLQDDQMAKAMGQQAAKHIMETYGWEKSIDKIIQAWTITAKL
ncbi:MAG: glycosyltransferase family 4 protein [Candidatus Buchananbacteria bacterium]